MIDSFLMNYRAAVSSESSNIDATGAYTGTIQQIEVYDSKSGATAACILFRADNGGVAWPSIWIGAKDGRRIYGADILMSVLACAGVPDTTPVRVVPGEVVTRDRQKMQSNRITVADRRRVGLVLQRENYTYTDREGNQKDGYRMNVIRAFFPDTRQTLAEKLAGRDPSAIDRLVQGLGDRVAKPAPTQKPAAETGGFENGGAGAVATEAAHAATEIGSDDIPF